MIFHQITGTAAQEPCLPAFQGPWLQGSPVTRLGTQTSQVHHSMGAPPCQGSDGFLGYCCAARKHWNIWLEMRLLGLPDFWLHSGEPRSPDSWLCRKGAWKV